MGKYPFLSPSTSRYLVAWSRHALNRVDSRAVSCDAPRPARAITSKIILEDPTQTYLALAYRDPLLYFEEVWTVFLLFLGGGVVLHDPFSSMDVVLLGFWG